jgi:hypothetical protein
MDSEIVQSVKSDSGGNVEKTQGKIRQSSRLCCERSKSDVEETNLMWRHYLYEQRGKWVS